MPRHSHTHLHFTINLTIQPGGTIDEITVTSNGESRAAESSADTVSATVPGNGQAEETLDPTVEAAVKRLASSGYSRHIPTLVNGLHEAGYQFIPAGSVVDNPQNYIRVMDLQNSRYAVAYMTPTYIEFTRAAGHWDGLAALPGAEVRGTTGIKFSHVASAKPGLDAAKLLMELSRKEGG
jgi:hypothetical protein